MPVQASPSRPAAIRIEVGGEEVREAARRGRSKVLILALITAIIGGVLGFAFGGGNERAKGAEAAVFGAKELLKLIDFTKLIDALMNQHRSLRTNAIDELRTYVSDNFGYYDDSPKRERQHSQKRYREWWENEGRARFVRRGS